MDTQTLLWLVAGLSLAVLALVVVLLLRRPTGLDLQIGENRRLQDELHHERERLQASQVTAAELHGRLDALRAEKEGLTARCVQAAQEIARLGERIERDASGIAERDVRLSERESALREASESIARMQHDLSDLRAEHQRLQELHASLRANFEHGERANKELRSYLDAAPEKLSGAFAELAGKVFEERGQQFEKNVRLATQQSRADVEALLKPFSDKIGEFRQRIDAVYGEESRERSSLLGAVNELKALNQDMASQAAALSNALKGNARARGDWGEMILETVLKASGLEADKHYKTQSNTRDEETGTNRRPDVIVSFPDSRQVAIDSKVNLVAWADYNSAQTHEEQQSALLEHTAALRKHVNDLAAKDYPRVIGAQSLDLTVLFVPIEGALAAALATNPTLQQEAWTKGIAFASPNTLMALLKVAERMWARDQMQKQVGIIGQHATQLLDSVSSFLSDFELIETRINALSSSYSDARHRLFESRQSVVARTKRLVEAGARGKKKLHDALQPSAEADDALPLLGADESAGPDEE